MGHYYYDDAGVVALQPADRGRMAWLEVQHTLLTAIPALIVIAASPAYLVRPGKAWLTFPRTVVLYAQLVSA